MFGKPTRKESCYDNLKITRNAWDTNLIKANPLYLSVNWEASGGGAFAIIPLSERGRLPEAIPLFRGHTGPVLDTDFNPFNDHIVASGSDDGKVFIWQIPEDFTLHTDAEEPVDISPVSKLTGHSRKVGQVLFNPSAENILASASGDYTIKLWDVSAGSSPLSLKHGDIVQSLSWNATGTLLATTSRDKKLRIWDVRQEREAAVAPGHSGAKNSRCVWMGEHDRVATTGFSKMSDRQMALWDTGNISGGPINGFEVLDSISGVCMPFWDDGTQMLYLAGKGDGNIRYFEYENDKLEFLSEYKSGDPQRGLAFLPRRGINVHENEIMRAFKTVNDSYIEPISFTVPRRAEVFQSDIYPPATGTKPGMSAAEWLAGAEGKVPAKIDLEAIYDSGAVVEAVPTSSPTKKENIPAPRPASPVKKEPEPVKKAPDPVQKAPEPERAPVQAPSMKDQKGSIAAMANKFQDDGEDDADGEESSSFEEVQRPAQRSIPKPAETSKFVPPANTSKPIEQPKVSNPTPTTTTSAPAPAPAPAVASNVEASLAQITQLLQEQIRTIAEQSRKIESLTGEVDTLKDKVSDGGNKGGETEKEREQRERIRELELELEEVRG